MWPFFFLGPDLLAQDHLLRHQTGLGRPGPSKKTHPIKHQYYFGVWTRPLQAKTRKSEDKMCNLKLIFATYVRLTRLVSDMMSCHTLLVTRSGFRLLLHYPFRWIKCLHYTVVYIWNITWEDISLIVSNRNLFSPIWAHRSSDSFVHDLAWALGIETRVLKNPGPGETRPFCQTRNPGLRAAETRVSGLCFLAA